MCHEVAAACFGDCTHIWGECLTFSPCVRLALRCLSSSSSFLLPANCKRPQEHQNEDLYEKAVSILETYFECEEGDDQNLAPQMAGNQYAFGQQAAQPGAFNFGGAPAGGQGGAFNFQG